MTTENPNDTSFRGLERVSSKRDEWVELSLDTKLEILNELTQRFAHTVGFENFYQYAGQAGLPMMGIPADTDEGKLQAQELVLLMVSLYKSHLYAMQQVYEKRVKNTLPKTYKTRKAINGQVCVQTFPTLPVSKSGLTSGCQGEIWLNKEAVPSEEVVKPYQFVDAEGVEKKSGLMIVLGAGNQSALALCDVLYGLFSRNCVCYLKLHALRYYTEPLVRILFEPLIRRGFVDLECHTTNERAAALVNHPLVTAVHLTGGKATHDAIVWGADPKDQIKNKQANTPVLKAEMTSELGAVSPWIVVPAKYTTAELKDQAGMLAAVIHSNASCNCNAPKMIVVSETWEQKEEFLNIVETNLSEVMLPVPYYPGAAQRWQTFRDHYPQAKLVESTSGLGVKERHLSKPMLSREATLLPHLAIEISIDLTSEQGRKSAKEEYAVNNEPFCPVYTVARLQHTETLEAFCETAATFCNNYVFGSLSGTVTVKPELQSSDACQHLIANLRYGSVGVNIWAGLCYSSVEGAWGAFPGESLANVESGIGRINNVLGFSGFEKYVMTSPIVSMIHPKLDNNIEKQAKILAAVNKLLIAPGIGPIAELVSSIVGIDMMTVLVVGGAALAALAGYRFTRSG